MLDGYIFTYGFAILLVFVIDSLTKLSKPRANKWNNEVIKLLEKASLNQDENNDAKVIFQLNYQLILDFNFLEFSYLSTVEPRYKHPQ